MLAFFKKPFRWAACYSVLLASAVLLVLLDTFVLPRSMTPAAEAPTAAERDTNPAEDTTQPSSIEVTDTSYRDGNIEITIRTLREYETDVYIADIKISDAKYLKTAFADNTYGRNFKQTTSGMAEENGAILAINGDFYGFRDYGFVLRNGVLYRDTAGGRGSEALAIDTAGRFSVLEEDSADLSGLADGLWQVLSFGPALIDGGEIAVTQNSKVNKEMSSNPRTAIGQAGELHYIFLVSDGRTDKSAGLSLYEMAEIMYGEGCSVAYNLDGGGSATMWFNGKVINNPTDGRKIYEREVSDIVYIG